MDTFVKQVVSGRHRRKYSAQFKRDAVLACLAPGVSMSAVALANGLNANVLRRWVTEHEGAMTIAPSAQPHGEVTTKQVEAFVPVRLRREAAPVADIKIELRSGAIQINIIWPAANASECAAWVAAVIR